MDAQISVETQSVLLSFPRLKSGSLIAYIGLCDTHTQSNVESSPVFVLVTLYKTEKT